MIPSLARCLFVFCGCFLYLFEGALSSTVASPNTLELIAFTSGLGFNLTEILSSPSVNGSSDARTSCENINKDNQCFKVIRTNPIPMDVGAIGNITRSCHQRDIFGCARHIVSEDTSLQQWIQTIHNSLQTFCSKDCLKDTKYMQNMTCSLLSATTKRTTKAVSKKQVSLLSEVLRVICSSHTDTDEPCVDSVNKYLRKTSLKAGKCVLSSDKNCSAECQEEAKAVNQTTVCCLQSTASVLKTYSVTGAPLQKLLVGCDLQTNTKCNKIVKPTTKPTEVERVSVSGRLVAGIIFSVVISLFGLSLMVRCLYRMIKRKKYTRYEDYGYSQLRMMEDALYDDIEESDDELLEA